MLSVKGTVSHTKILISILLCFKVSLNIQKNKNFFGPNPSIRKYFCHKFESIELLNVNPLACTQGAEESDLMQIPAKFTGKVIEQRVMGSYYASVERLSPRHKPHDQ